MRKLPRSKRAPHGDSRHRQLTPQPRAITTDARKRAKRTRRTGRQPMLRTGRRRSSGTRFSSDAHVSENSGCFQSEPSFSSRPLPGDHWCPSRSRRGRPSRRSGSSSPLCCWRPLPRRPARLSWRAQPVRTSDWTARWRDRFGEGHRCRPVYASTGHVVELQVGQNLPLRRPRKPAGQLAPAEGAAQRVPKEDPEHRVVRAEHREDGQGIVDRCCHCLRRVTTSLTR
jgi:hypothetical protein